MSQNKIKVFLDADDTILSSSQTIIEILNDRYSLTPRKTILDLQDWDYRSIYKGMTHQEVENLYESDVFFNRVSVYPEFQRVYKKFKDDFHFVVVTKGTEKNLKKKEQFFQTDYPDIEFYGIPFIQGNYNFDKKEIDMSNSIQIDDRCDCLYTNAACKILLRNNIDVNWNRYVEDIPGNVYAVNSWNEIGKILLFTIANDDWYKL